MGESLSSAFNEAAAPGDTRTLEKILTDWSVDFQKRDDGTLFVPGDFDISHFKVDALPDLTAVEVAGNFHCFDNNLTSLKGAPRKVGGSFDCSENQLTSLEGAPASVGMNFYCHKNKLTSLEFAATDVGNAFRCDQNRLTSLKGAPEKVSGLFWCQGNLLTDLEYAPKLFRVLNSDFGEYKSWSEVPEGIQLSAATRAQREAEFVAQATVLQAPVQAIKTLSFRK